MGEPARLDRHAIILAGGDGKRLEPLVQRLRGDNLPKQYVNFLGRRSMLEHTFDRVEKLIVPECIMTVVTRDHLRFPDVTRQLSVRPQETIIVQPIKKDTAPGVLLPLMHLYKRNPESIVALFPSDHFVLEEDRFMSHVSLAFEMVEQNPSLLILLGIAPTEPEPEYGYILPRGNRTDRLKIQRVSRFVEKPDPREAQHLILNGGLWNTFVMISRTKRFLGIISDLAPELFAKAEELGKAIGTRNEVNRINAIYQDLKPANFSKAILERLPQRCPSCLSVLAVENVLWSDWGLPRSIAKVVQKTGHMQRTLNVDGVFQSPLCGVLREIAGFPPSIGAVHDRIHPGNRALDVSA
ncbi:MAG TPA: sugar phosphate nucleotidyltransferase [Candidatus Binatia bacterium]|jgi:mannose-1-phosphate guanylyltransferase